ncbi:MAG: hypothetical protein NTW85_00175 [Methylococcales bacterium]|nr:hypothetical protein [Methylococcales bacterium]
MLFPRQQRRDGGAGVLLGSWKRCVTLTRLDVLCGLLCDAQVNCTVPRTSATLKRYRRLPSPVT